jgi:hypothetical protein
MSNVLIVGGNESRTLPKWTKKLADRGATVVGHHDYEDGGSHISLSGVDYVVLIKELVGHPISNRVQGLCAKHDVPFIVISKDWARAAPILCHKGVIKAEQNGAPKPTRAQVEEAAVDLIVDIRQNEGREPSLSEVSQIMQQTFRLPSAPGYAMMRRATSRACQVTPPQRVRAEDRVDPRKFLVDLIEEIVRDDPAVINSNPEVFATALSGWFDQETPFPKDAETVVEDTQKAIRERWEGDAEERYRRVFRWTHLYTERLYGNLDLDALPKFDLPAAIDAAEDLFGFRPDRFLVGAESDRQRAFMEIPDIGDDFDDVLSGLAECIVYHTELTGLKRSKEWVRKRLLRPDFDAWRIPGAARGRDVWITTKTQMRNFFTPPPEVEEEEPVLTETVPTPTDEVVSPPSSDEAFRQIDEWVDLLTEREESVTALVTGLDEATERIRQTFATFQHDADASLEGARDKLAVQLKATLEITENLNKLGKGLQGQARELTSRLDTYASALSQKLQERQKALVDAIAVTVEAEVTKRLKTVETAVLQQISGARQEAVGEVREKAKGIIQRWGESVADKNAAFDAAVDQAVAAIRDQRVQVSPALALMEAVEERGMGIKLEITPPAKVLEKQ